MSKYTWDLFIHNKNYSITIKHNIFTGRRTICVNGDTVISSKKPFNNKNEESFQLDNHSFTIKIKPYDLGYSYFLFIDDNEFKEKPPCPTPKVKMPIWTLIFIFANLSIPIFSVEDIVPWILGIGASILCVKVSKNSKKSTIIKLLYCSFILLGALTINYFFGNSFNLLIKFITNKF